MVCVDDRTFSIGSITKGYATYAQAEAVTASGNSVLVITEDRANNLGYYNGDWYDQEAYWVDGNVFYQLRVVGDKKDDAKVQDILQKLLSAF
jgi:hypothetical protein